MTHIHIYDDIKNLTIKELIDKILVTPKIVIKDIKLIDLIYDRQSLIGVYVIFDPNGKPVYVGKTGSRSILERISAHYDLRPNGFMNTFLCALAGMKKGRNGPQATSEDIKIAYDKSLDYKLVFVEIAEKSKITTLESILARELKPELNSIKGTKPYKLDTKIEDI